ncbi:adenosine kinase [Devosia sp. 63-57]|uniref:adenosine kinase n=1 Tax=Devosia sp. 63-57 TaxID=1895751 RepID=UPI00086EDC17|nr:adenosine kinase [Devosia sp. 63-57]ODT49538.1 MAG: carbohydrate kinase [Pelagibacterium sp. SCN 63-126]ODU85454.1 MAG: carbohydrate kinase [Pelagibacterium sp. SCN 63-17]OJX43547.1 MAG: adenosine kinase [Devosia sp. 63-57]
MTQTRFDVLTIGNAIVDIIAPVEAGFIEREGMQEGIMHLIDTDRAEDLYGKMPASRKQISGGSAANTAAGVASLGGRAAFVGKVADDPLGDVFAADLTDIGVFYGTSRLKNGALTARSMIFLSADGERTMNTYLGACHQLTEADIHPDEIGGAAVTYMEGFLWDPVEAKKAFVLAAHYAHKHERAAAFTLSDPFCVDRYRAEFLDLIRSKTIDYVFANVHELKSLYQTDDLGVAVREIAKDAEVAAITMGAEGAMAVFNGEIISVPAFPVEKVVDATGAGDLFAAGFLLGLARGQTMESALKTGCLAASEVISHIGARPQLDLAELSQKHGLVG